MVGNIIPPVVLGTSQRVIARTAPHSIKGDTKEESPQQLVSAQIRALFKPQHDIVDARSAVSASGAPVREIRALLRSLGSTDEPLFLREQSLVEKLPLVLENVKNIVGLFSSERIDISLVLFGLQEQIASFEPASVAALLVLALVSSAALWGATPKLISAVGDDQQDQVLSDFATSSAGQLGPNSEVILKWIREYWTMQSSNAFYALQFLMKS